jgi:hypothetical protein
MGSTRATRTAPGSLSRRRPGSIDALLRRLGLGLAPLVAAALLGGCGGGSKPPTGQLVAGDGFSFQAPSAWLVRRTPTATEAIDGSVDRTEVIRFRLVRAYRPALFAAAAKELDGVIARLARELSGRVTASATVSLAGESARSYRLRYPHGRMQIGFVLAGDTEYELLCRLRVGDPDAPCRQLFATFVLSSA